MTVISNTSPLLNLSIIGHLDLVREQFGEVHTPPAVEEELRLDASRPGSQELREALDRGWITIRDVTSVSLARTLRRDLDRGEAEAIALAVEADADLMLLDEKDGRKRARSLELPITGVIGVLIRADEEGTVSSLEDALDRLQEEAGFWLSPSLREQVLRGRT
jgi:predicted nucleic acid-binding protein